MKKMLFTIGIVATTFAIAGCQKQSEAWVGFFHENGYVECAIQEFETEEQCTKWAEAKKDSNDDYTCGYKCQYNDACEFICEQAVGSKITNH